MSTFHHRRLLGEAVKKARLNAKISQERLAALADTSTSFISRLERGSESPSLDNIVKVAKGLGVRVKDLIEF